MGRGAQIAAESAPVGEIGSTEEGCLIVIIARSYLFAMVARQTFATEESAVAILTIGATGVTNTTAEIAAVEHVMIVPGAVDAMEDQ